MDLMKNLPGEILKAAESKISSFNKLKTEIDSGISEIHEKVKVVSKRIRENIKCEQNPEGLLTRKESDYLRCLRIEYRTLKDMFK